MTRTKREFTSQADLQSFVAKYLADMLAGNESPDHDRETKKRMRQLQEDPGIRTGICVEECAENTYTTDDRDYLCSTRATDGGVCH